MIHDTDTRLLRVELNMSQTQFARAFPGINLRTLQNWEFGQPKGEIARAYLAVIAAMPIEVKRVWARLRRAS